MKGCFGNMETHLQTLLKEWRVATDLSLWFSLLSPVAVSLAPGLQSSQAILGQLLIFSMGYLFPLLICSCWDMGRNSELLKRWQSFCRSTKSSGWFSLSYEWGTSPYPSGLLLGPPGSIAVQQFCAKFWFWHVVGFLIPLPYLVYLSLIFVFFH